MKWIEPYRSTEYIPKDVSEGRSRRSQVPNLDGDTFAFLDGPSPAARERVIWSFHMRVQEQRRERDLARRRRTWRWIGRLALVLTLFTAVALGYWVGLHLVEFVP